MDPQIKWEDCKVTWWLYFYGEPLTSVRAHICATPAEVRRVALQQNMSPPPLDTPEALCERAGKIAMCQVTL